MPADDIESAATRNVAPRGMITRTGSPDGPAQALTTRATETAAHRIELDREWCRIVLVGKTQRVLQKQRGGHGIDVSLAPFCGATHLAHATQRSRSRVSLINVLHR